MSTELSGLELRKAACEACGYEIRADPKTRVHSIWRHGDVVPGCSHIDKFERDVLGYLPAIESDPTASERLFLEWCEKNRYCYRYWGGGKSSLIDDELIIFSNEEGEDSDRVCKVFGSTPSEARARAIVAAIRSAK